MTKNTENVPPNVSKRSIIVPIDEESELSSPSEQQELGSNRKKPRQLHNTDSRWHILGRDCSSRFGTDDEGCAQLHPPNRNFCQTDDFVQPAKFSEIREGNIEECLTEKRRNTQTGPMREVSRKPSSPGKVRELILSKRRVSSLPPLPTSAPSCEIEEAQSVFEFKNVGFVVGKGNKQKDVLTNITHTMKSGELLAMMGPSGAGKTSLLNVLTLDADYGTASGTVLLDKQPMDDSLFRRHCFIVKQQDKHWDYLTARETLVFAGKLFEVAQSEDDVRMIIEETIDALGLGNCADTKCFRLSGGEKRRLSLAVALLKTPQVLFLDEPTSGLDSASALAVANEISRVAKEAKMIIICVIHQPSTRVFGAFDQVMILSRGRQAYTGNVEDALSYFHNIGYPLPYATNPAEHFLDLVNADFSDEDEVQRILLIWQDHVSRMKNSKIEHVLSTETQNEGDGANKIVVNQDEKKSHSSSSELDSLDSNNVPKNEESSSRLASTFNKQLNMMLRRQFKLAKRDPLYYLGRCGAYLATGLFFSLVYWHARPYVQSQAINKVRVTLWLSGVPAITSVVAVYSTGMEFNLIQLETKNGMVKPLSFVLAREILTLPIMIVFAMFAMGIPGFVIQDFPPSAFGTVILLWATMMYAYESLAAALGIWCGTDPILGMLVYTMVWFITYLFSGAPLEIESMYWPFKACYYLNHLTYYIRSIIYVICTESTWETCDMTTSNGSDASAICVPNDPPRGEHILDALGLFFGGISSENTVLKDFVVMLSIAFSYKIIYVCGVIVKTHNSAKMGGKDIKKVA